MNFKVAVASATDLVQLIDKVLLFPAEPATEGGAFVPSASEMASIISMEDLAASAKEVNGSNVKGMEVAAPAPVTTITWEGMEDIQGKEESGGKAASGGKVALGDKVVLGGKAGLEETQECKVLRDVGDVDCIIYLECGL